MLTRHLTITGQVQGVFYRAWTQQQANALGITGWVRNRDDGSVEALVEGEEEVVREMVERMRQGPAGARVDEIREEDAAVFGGTEFEVCR